MDINQAPPVDDGNQTEPKLSVRTVVIAIVGAVAFFAVGYTVAWFSFVSAADQQTAGLEGVVGTAVADAISNADLGAAVVQAPSATATPSVYEVSTAGSPSIGPEDAPITMVEFSDFRCGYCGRFEAQTFDALLEAYGDQIRFVYRHFPVVGGERAALASECAAAQDAFWPYHDRLFENQQLADTDEAFVQLASDLDLDAEAFATCMADEAHMDTVQQDFSEGVSFGLRGTPSFFINGRLIVGAQPISAFRAIIDEELATLEEAG
jgi:protein-disulfide isomerase